MESDTPRTDKAYFSPGATMYDVAGECKKLERELTAALSRCKALEQELARSRREYDMFYAGVTKIIDDAILAAKKPI